MKPDPEIEYLPLHQSEEQQPKQGGFLSRLFRCLIRVTIRRFGPSSTPSSGKEVEEDVIEY
jgi:hypothetical protein